MLINRRQVLIGTVGAAAGLTIVPAFGQVPPLKKKDTYKVGFAQTESNNPWRLAQTASMKDEAAKRGCQLVYTDAASSAAKQVADVNSMIAQGVDFIFLAPREEKPLIPAIMAAKKAGIPVLLVDRNVDQSLAKAGQDYLAFIGSNFVQEGQRVADWTIAKTGGKGKIIELEGSVGASPANDRKKGFDETIKAKAPEMVDPRQPVRRLRPRQGPAGRRDAAAGASRRDHRLRPQRRNGARRDRRDRGGRQGPGQGHSRRVDRRREGRASGDRRRQVGRSCECNPRFGPAAFDIMYNYANGEKIPPVIINPDRFFDASNAKEMLPTAF